MDQAMNSQINYINGDRYVGQVYATFTGTVPHGRGIMYYANGSTYNGYWNNATRHGYGDLSCSNGDTYRGSWYQNYYHGQGESYDAAKRRHYKGGYVLGNESGQGKITAPSLYGFGGERIYIGEMKDNLRHGYGTLWFPDQYGRQTVFEGQWANGVLNGQGKQTNPAECLSGTFIDGKLEGLGTRTDPTTGKIQTVYFSGGIVVQKFGY